MTIRSRWRKTHYRLSMAPSLRMSRVHAVRILQHMRAALATTLNDVREAMDRGQLFVEYQPIVSLLTHCCLGAEALVRWRRSDGVLPAGEFMTLVEGTPLSGRLTYWVIDTVAHELGGWLGEHRDVYISINVPPEILGRGGLEYAAVRSGLREHAHQIVLEITERGVPDRLGLEALNAMVEHGVRIALDDALITAANVALLSRARFEIIKVDRDMTAQLASGAPEPEWFAELRTLLRHSSLQVIAEGVESSYQAEALTSAGVQMAQGFLFAASLTAQDLMKFHGGDRQALGVGHA